MKIKISKKDATLIRNYIGRSTGCEIMDFCKEKGIKKGRKVDRALFKLYMDLNHRLTAAD